MGVTFFVVVIAILPIVKTYDAIVVLGSQPDPATWKFPKQVYDCLDRAMELLNQDNASHISVSGDHGIKLDNLNIKQPFKECDVLADYLLKRGVPSDKILKEGESRDTISNLYYLKTQVFIPQQMKYLLFVVAEFRIPRLQFLCKRILGKDYMCDFESISSKTGSTYNESHTLKIQSAFLEPMADGNHNWLDGKFYDAPMYQYWRQHDQSNNNIKISK